MAVKQSSLTMVNSSWMEHMLDNVRLPQVIATISLFLFFYITYNLFLHPLRHVPGPWIARAGLPSPLVAAMAQKRIQFYIYNLHEKYGKTVRYSVNRISTVHPNAAAILYSHKSKYTKSSYYDAFSLFEVPNVFSCRNIQDHSNIRRSVSSAFTLTSLVDLEEYVDTVLDDLLHNLDNVAQRKSMANKDGNSIDMSFTFQAFAMDVIGELGFGRSFGLTKSGTDPNHLLASLDMGIGLSSVLGLYGPVAVFFNYILSWIPVPGINYLQRISRESVEARMTRVHTSEQLGGEPRKDMLTKLVQAKNPVTRQPLNKVELITHASSIVGAGSDTTSITMRAFFIFILSNPTVKQKLLEELDTAVNNGSLTFPCSYRDGIKLQYFQACLKETLRLHPAVSYILERIVPDNEFLQLDQYTIPPGCIVGISPTTYHRQTEIYGENAEEFVPSRWLVPEEKLSYLERQNLAFGAGSRVCLGKNISLMEMTKVLPYLFYRYNFDFTPRSPTSPHALKVGRGHDGIEGPEVPYHISSTWFSNPKDFYCNISIRHEES